MNYLDGAHSIGVQNVTSNWKVATLISFIFLYLARRLASGETFIHWKNILKPFSRFQTSIKVRISVFKLVYTDTQQN